MGSEAATDRAVVQRAGFAYQLTSARLEHEFERHGALFHGLLRCAPTDITLPAIDDLRCPIGISDGHSGKDPLSLTVFPRRDSAGSPA